MPPESISLLFLATALLLLAHAARAARWAFLFPRNAVPARLSLLMGLGIGYAVNALVPLRVGELIRGAVAARLTRVRFSYVMATIFAERTADLALLALMILVTSGLASDSRYAHWSAAFFTAAALAILAFALVVRHSRRARRLVWRLAGIFNDRIRVELADFAWSASELLLGGSLLRWRFVTATIIMWGLYAAAYASFGRLIGAPVLDVVAAILQQPLEPLAASIGNAGAIADRTSLIVFTLTPILLILTYGALMQSQAIARSVDIVLRHGRSGRGSPTSHSDRFSAITGYQSFLGAHFSGDDQAVSGFGMEAVSDCIVHKFYHGGSDAVTALVETDERLVIRKFAVGSAAAKLQAQALWLQRHAELSIPLVEVVAERQGSNVFSYDMPLLTPANDFYDVIHSSTSARNRERMMQVLGHVDALHAQTALGDADREPIEAYLEEKVVRNAAAVLEFGRGMLGRSDYSINNVAHDLHDWQCLADRAWLLAQLRDRRVATIHGDLTVENVIIAPDHPAGLYIIDPNPENIFDSPLIDWAKMMQSLHLGYETLNRGISFSLSAGDVQLAATRSQAYAELHADLEAEIVSRFGDDGLREVYFHELVNYLRLTTYKMRQSQSRGFGFFVCCSILLSRYRERFG